MPKRAENESSVHTDASAERLCALVEASERAAAKLSEMLELTELARAELAEEVRHGAEMLAKPRPAPATGDAPAPPESAESLRAQIAELAMESEHLETARAVAEAADQAKSCFLAAMSRELRTPVDGLARMIDLLQQTDLNDDQRQYLRTANYSVSALLSLLDSVLSASRIDAGVPELRSTDFDLRRSVEQVLRSLAPLARTRGLRLVSDVAGDVPSLVRGELGKLRQVIFFIVRRAIQLASEGEIAVDATVARATSAVTTTRFTISNAETVLTQPQLIDVFNSGTDLEKSPGETTGCRGVGAAIARQIVELMGGRIGVDRGEDRGFTIWFTTPLDNYLKRDDDRREHGRLPQELLQSSLGPVLDLSMGGMRVRCKRPPKGDLDVELMDIEEPVSLKSKVMWVRRIGFRKFDVGVNFMAVPPNVAKQLTRISLNHRLRRLLGFA